MYVCFGISDWIREITDRTTAGTDKYWLGKLLIGKMLVREITDQDNTDSENYWSEEMRVRKMTDQENAD